MDNGTIIEQGYFTADGNAKLLELPSGVDWLEITNYTEYAASNSGHGYKYFWQRGLGTSGFMEYHPAADHTAAVNVITGAFTEFDQSTYAGGSWVSVSAGTNATAPSYSTGDTTGLATGSIVRLKGTNQYDLNGIDFTVDSVVASTSFDLANTLATAPGSTAGASGYYKLVAPTLEIYNMFRPAVRNIGKITQATQAVVTTLVDHNFEDGSLIRFSIPSEYGMVELDGLVGTVVSQTAGTFTVDIDTTGFSAFTYPTATVAASAISPAIANPIGASTDLSYNIGGNSTEVYNQGVRGMILTAGTAKPAGSVSDVIYWRAGKSFGQ